MMYRLDLASGLSHSPPPPARAASDRRGATSGRGGLEGHQSTTMRTSSFLLLGGAAAFLSSAALVAAAEDQPESANRLAGVSFDTTLSAAHTFAGKADFQGAKPGESGAFDAGLNLRASAPLDDTWSWSLGVRSQNLFFDSLAATPIPDRVHTLGLTPGVGYRIDSKWVVNAFAGPNLYRFEDVDSGAVGVTGGAFATYMAHARLRVTFGLAITPDSDLKVFPMVGLRWRIDDRSTLELGVPRTRFSYSPATRWTLYGGLDMVGTTFRADREPREFAGLAGYDNALATYRDVRLGAGAGCQLLDGLRAELEAGASVYRRIDYTRIDTEVRFDPAPYVRLGLNCRF